jgi:hypothetical protein
MTTLVITGTLRHHHASCVLQRNSESDIHSEVIRVALVGFDVLSSITCPAGGDATPITEACRKDSSSDYAWQH